MKWSKQDAVVTHQKQQKNTANRCAFKNSSKNVKYRKGFRHITWIFIFDHNNFNPLNKSKIHEKNMAQLV